MAMIKNSSYAFFLYLQKLYFKLYILNFIAQKRNETNNLIFLILLSFFHITLLLEMCNCLIG